MLTRREFVGLGAAAVLELGAIGPRGFARAAEAKTLLMLGGTGFLGPQTVEAALRRGYKVTLFNRGKTRPGLFPDLEKLHGDRDKDDLKALEGRKWNAVVDTSANVPRWVKKAGEVLGPNIDHYIYISSISAYADLSKPGCDETAPLATIADPTTEKIDGGSYGALKALTEKAAETAMPGKVAVVRPGLIVGPEDPSDRFTYWPVRVARGGEVLAPGSADDPIQLIDVRDLGEFLVELIEKQDNGRLQRPRPGPQTDHGPYAGSLQGGRTKRRHRSRGPTRVSWRSKASRPGATCLSGFQASGETAGFASVSNARAIKAGLKFRPIAETAKATLDWFKTLPQDRRAKLRAGLTPDREAKVLKAWKSRAEKP